MDFYNWIQKEIKILSFPIIILMEVELQDTGAPVQYFPKEE